MYAKSILKILVIGLLSSGCSDVAEKFRNQYNPSRAVVDQGGSNVFQQGMRVPLMIEMPRKMLRKQQNIT